MKLFFYGVLAILFQFGGFGSMIYGEVDQSQEEYPDAFDQEEEELEGSGDEGNEGNEGDSEDQSE